MPQWSFALIASRLLGWMPAAMRVPAAAGAIVFAAAVGTTQVALQIENREADRQLERLGQVYMDGLLASVHGDLDAADRRYVTQRFERAFSEQHGIVERALFAFDADGRLLTRHGDPALPTELATVIAPGSFSIDHAARIAWIARAADEGRSGRIVAALDLEPILAARTRLKWGTALVDLLIAMVCALLAYRVLRRMERPLSALVSSLSEARNRTPIPVGSELLAQADKETAVVLEAYNRMVEGVRERERLAAELAGQQQAAALGRLAATIAHEVRNPLGGLATAVSTIKRFGEEPEVRREAVDILERGIETLDRIVTSTLNVYRPAEDRRLKRADLEDLRHLLVPAAERSGVQLAWNLALPDELALGSAGVRQVLLNLLLNACAVTPAGGVVGLSARVEGGELRCEVTDQGGGFDGARAEQLTGTPGTNGEPLPSATASRRLGLDVVVQLLRALDGRASVTSIPSGGTSIRLAIPLEQAA